MHLVTNTKEPWDFWYELSDWVLKYLDMGDMRLDIIASKVKAWNPNYWSSLIQSQRRLRDKEKPITITSLRFEKSDRSHSTFLVPGTPRKRGTKQQPGQMIIYIGPEAEGRKARAFTAILWLAKGLSAFGAPQVPDENLGFYRQPIGAAFMENWRDLLKEWRK